MYVNHRNTLKKNEIHNISHLKYIDRVQAKQSYRRPLIIIFMTKMLYCFNLENAKIVCNFTMNINSYTWYRLLHLTNS